MSVTREAFIEGCTENDTFIQFMKKHTSQDDPFSVDELLASCSKKQLEDMWCHLQLTCTTTLLNFHMDEDQLQNLDEEVAVLQGIITVAMATLTQDDVSMPQSLLDTAVVLHGVLPSLPDEFDKLRNNIAKLCEYWWCSELPGRESLTTQSLFYLLNRSLQHKATVSDVKRIWQLRDSLRKLHLEDEGNQQMKNLLLQTLISAQFLKCEEGRRFLAFLFSLTVEFIEILHRTVKNQLPSASRTMLKQYGEIYFRAWHLANTPFVEKLEEYCIQDLMFHAIHTGRQLAPHLRQMLNYFHHQKKQRGVDSMLLRLYEPILWRSLQAANGAVRANAAALLVDAFPLQEPSVRMEDSDQLMQKQFDILQRLLGDPCTEVRSTVVRGVCRICSAFWEVIPPQVIKSFTVKLVQDLAWDRSSADVRVAVLKGMGVLLDNHLSHPMLKTLLPDLRNLFHDNSEKVRIAFTDLLLKVKGLRAIKFWVVVPIEHLLARLEVDSRPVCVRIVSLIFNSYMPMDKPQEVQLTRCISMIESSPGATRRFYQYASRHLSVDSATKFLLLLCRCVLKAVQLKQLEERRSNEATSDSSQDYTIEKDILESSSDEEDNQVSANKENQESSVRDAECELTADNLDVMTGLLETMVVLWSSIADQLRKKNNAVCLKKLQKLYSFALPQFFKAFQEPRIVTSLIMIGGFLPSASLPTISGRVISKLRGMEPTSSVEEYGTMLESVCHWGRVDDILDLISDWLSAGLNAANPTDTPSSSKVRRSRKGVTFSEPTQPRPMLALDYINYLLPQTVCRTIILETHRQSLRELSRLLEQVKTGIENRLRSPESLEEPATDDFLIKAFETYLKIRVILHDQDIEENNAISVFGQLLSWADSVLLAVFRKISKKKKTRKLLGYAENTLLAGPSGSDTMMGVTSQTLSTTAWGSQTLMSETMLGVKRGTDDSETSNRFEICSSLIESMLTIASNMLLVGVGDHEFASELSDFALNLLQLDKRYTFFPVICQLMYQITELTVSCDGGDNDEGLGSHTDIASDMLVKIIQRLATLTKEKKEQAQRMLPTLRPVFTEMLQTYYRHKSLNETINKDIMATLSSICIAEVGDCIEQDSLYEACGSITELPLLSSFVITLLAKKDALLKAYLDEFCQFVESGSLEKVESSVACVHIIHAIKHDKKRLTELESCLTALRKHMDDLQIDEDLSEDSPIRALVESGRKLLSENIAPSEVSV